jgi:hypothetical protein
VTPNPCGLMKQTRNGPVAGWCRRQGRSTLRLWMVQSIEAGTEYPMRAVRNDHAFAFMELALSPVRFKDFWRE